MEQDSLAAATKKTHAGKASKSRTAVIDDQHK